MKAVKKQIEVEFIQYDGRNIEEVMSFCPQCEVYYDSCLDMYDLYIYTLEGRMLANSSDCIIKGVKGEFYPCKYDIFLKTYDIVND